MNRISLDKSNKNVTIFFKERPGIDFEIKKEIGRGASCIVYYAVSSENTEHLLKEYYPKHLELIRNGSGEIVVSEDKKEAFEQGLERFRTGYERQKNIRLLNKKLKNYVCNVQGCFTANGTEYIDMTCFNGETYDNIQEKSVYNLMLRMRTLVQVVGEYHKAGLLHLDIKPENIYVRPEGETVEDVMLFDFDSVTPINEIVTSKTLSCTKTWAAPEQILFKKRESICPATDLFAIGEIIFVQLFRRHSFAAERCSFVTKYPYDYNAEIFKDMNPKVFSLLDNLLCHTICGAVDKRYPSAEELIETLDKIIKLADPKEPYIGKNLPVVQEFFIGRDEELAEIHRLLNDEQNKNKVVFLSGVGGIGKTELAKQYSHKYEKEYDSILFAPYISGVKSLILDDMPIYNFAQSPNEKKEEYFNRKLLELKKLCDERTLIIVDNLDRMDDPDFSKLMELNCKLVVTTRSDFSRFGYGKQLSIDTLKKAEDIDSIFYYHYQGELSQEDRGIIRKIIQLVAGHTMAVELIAKQIDAEWATPAEILKKLKSAGIHAIGDEDVDSGKDGLPSSRSAYHHVKALFDLSVFEKTEKENELYVLNNLCLIPYTGIDKKLFARWCVLDEHGGKGVVNRLVKSGWVRESDQKISLHRVIAEVVIERLSDIEQAELPILENSIAYARKDSTFETVRNIVTNPELAEFNHCKFIDFFLCMCQKIVRFAPNEKIARFIEVVINDWNVSDFSYSGVEIMCLENVLEIREKLSESDALKQADTARRIGDICQRYIRHFEMMKRISDKQGQDELAKEYAEKANLYYSKADKYCHDVLDFSINQYGEISDETAKIYVNLQYFYGLRRNFGDQIKYLRKAIDIYREIYPDGCEIIDWCYQELDDAYKNYGNKDAAEDSYH